MTHATMKAAIDAGEDVEGVEVRAHDGRATGPCGCCGKRRNAGSLLDVRAHLFKKLRPWSFLCSDCWSVLVRPGRKMERDGVKAVSKSAFVRGFPGAERTAKAHELRKRARGHILDTDKIP